MTLGRARFIFNSINLMTISDAEKIEAINIVMNTPTFNSVKKETLINVLRYLLERGLISEANRQEAATDGR